MNRWAAALELSCNRRLSARCGTGSGSDLVTPVAHNLGVPGRYRSPYRTAAEMIQNDVELAGTQERIAYFCRLVAHMRKVEKPENFPYLASGYLAEIERMNAEVLEYLRHHASETVTAEAV